MVVRCNSFSHFGPTSAYVLEVVFLKKKKRVYSGKDPFWEILDSFRDCNGRWHWLLWALNMSLMNCEAVLSLFLTVDTATLVRP